MEGAQKGGDMTRDRHHKADLEIHKVWDLLL